MIDIALLAGHPVLAEDPVPTGDPVLDRAMALHPRVALRPEPFGALAYHYDTRRLNFLRSHDLVALIETLADHPSPRAAFDAGGVDPARWSAFSKAIIALAASSFLEPVDTDSIRTHPPLSEESA